MFIFSFTTLVNHTQFCQPFCLLGVCTTNHPKQEFRFQTVQQMRYVTRSQAFQECFAIDPFPSALEFFFMQVEDDLAARRLQRRPSRDFFLADESWEGIFCGVVIPDRGMITYSTFIVGIPIVTMPIRSFFKGSILIPSLLLNPHAIKSV